MTTILLNIKTRLFKPLANLGMMLILTSCSPSSAIEEPVNPPAPPASSVEKSEYYVSTTGNDENPGTFTSPWRTIQKAVTTVPPGAVVNIMGGTYYEEVKVTVSGTADKYIVIQNYNDEEVIISGDNKPRELMNLNGVSYIKVKGLTFADCLGSYSVGIKISTTSDEASHHIEIESNTVRNLYANATATPYPPNVYVGGITVAGYLDSKAIHDIIIRGNTVRDCRTGWTEAISITGNVDGFLVTQNVVTNTGNIGIDASGHWGISNNPSTDFARNGIISENHVSYCKSLIEGGAGIYLDGSSNILVERNISHNNVYGITVGCERPNNFVTNNIIRSNICYNNEGFGIGLMGWSPEDRIIKNCQVVNNTTFGNAKENLGEIAVYSTENTTIKNNIFYSTHTNSNLLYVYDSHINLNMDFNHYYSSSPHAQFYWKGSTFSTFEQYKQNSGCDLTSAYGNPLFIDTEVFDFQLQSTSPCIDAGDPAYVPSENELDFNHNPRKAGTCIDKGAYEKQ